MLRMHPSATLARVIALGTGVSAAAPSGVISQGLLDGGRLQRYVGCPPTSRAEAR